MRAGLERVREPDQSSPETALVGDGAGGAVEFGDGGGELLVASGSAVLKNPERDGFAEEYGLVRVAAVMNSGACQRCGMERLKPIKEALPEGIPMSRFAWLRRNCAIKIWYRAHERIR